MRYTYIILIFLFINSIIAQDKYVIDPNFNDHEIFSESIGGISAIFPYTENSFFIRFPSYVKGATSQTIFSKINSNGDLDLNFKPAIKSANLIADRNKAYESISVFEDGKILISGFPKPTLENGESHEVIILNKDGSFIKGGNIINRSLKTFPLKDNKNFFAVPVLNGNFFNVVSSGYDRDLINANLAKLRKFDSNLQEDINFKFEGSYKYFLDVLELNDGKILIVGIENVSGGAFEFAKIKYVIERYLPDGKIDKSFSKISFEKNNRNDNIPESFQLYYNIELDKVYYIETPEFITNKIGTKLTSSIKEINQNGTLSTNFDISLIEKYKDFSDLETISFANNHFYFFYEKGIAKTDVNGNIISDISFAKLSNSGFESGITGIYEYYLFSDGQIVVTSGGYQFEKSDNKNKEFWGTFKLDKNLIIDRSYKSKQYRFVDVEIVQNKKNDLFIESFPKRQFFSKENILKTEDSDFMKLNEKGDIDTLSFEYNQKKGYSDGYGNLVYASPIKLYASYFDEKNRLFAIEGDGTGFSYSIEPNSYLSMIDEDGIIKRKFVNLTEKFNAPPNTYFYILGVTDETIIFSFSKKYYSLNLKSTESTAIIFQRQDGTPVPIYNDEKVISLANKNLLRLVPYTRGKENTKYFSASLYDSNGKLLKNITVPETFVTLYTQLAFKKKNNYIIVEGSFLTHSNGSKINTKYPTKRFIDFEGNISLDPPAEHIEGIYDNLNINLAGQKVQSIKVLKKNNDNSIYAMLDGYRFVKLIKTKSQKQSITFNPIGDKTTKDYIIKLNAISTSGLPVKFKVVNGPAHVYQGNNLTLDGSFGEVTVKAFQEGNELFEYQESIQTFKVNRISQEIQFTAISDKYIETLAFLFPGKSTSSLPLNITVLSGPAIVVGQNIVLTKQVGEVKLKVSQEGNYQFLPANDVFINFKVTNILANENSASNKFILYPNPIEGKFQIISPFKEYKVLIIDPLGKIVRQYFDPQTDNYSISDLRNGIYFVLIKTKDNSVYQTFKILKN